MSDCWLQTGAGIAFDLCRPRPEMVDFDIDIAESLSRQARFNGHVRSGHYSVAQHCVMGADALMREYGSVTYAAAFLLHDAHEAYLGDIITPVKNGLKIYTAEAFLRDIARTEGRALAERQEVAQGALIAGAKAFQSAATLLCGSIDRAIYEAAGISFPLPHDVVAAVTYMDLRMLNTERRHLLGPSPKPWPPAVESAKPIRFTGRFPLWPWPQAADEYRDRLRRYLPGLKPSRKSFKRAA